jgi:hypothetical protein
LFHNVNSVFGIIQSCRFDLSPPRPAPARINEIASHFDLSISCQTADTDTTENSMNDDTAGERHGHGRKPSAGGRSFELLSEASILRTATFRGSRT